MPKSKSKRDNYKPPPKPNPEPSPPWVPYVGVGLLLAGLFVVLFNSLSRASVLPGGNWWLVAAFVFASGGLLVLSRWR